MATTAELKAAYRANALFDAHQDDPEFGHRLLHDEAAAAGEVMGDRTAWKLCSMAGWFSATCKKSGAGQKVGPPVLDDLTVIEGDHGETRHDFTTATTGINQLLVGDITEHRTSEGKLYMCAFKDTHYRRIVGYSIDSRMTASLAMNAVQMRANLAGCIVNTDRGSQFRSRKFLATFKAHGLRGSMGRVGAAGDNAAMESFFALLQNNVLNRRVWATREQLRIAIVTWIETRYHRRRRQAGLVRLTPVEFELIKNQPAAHAA